ncbi:MAG: ribose 5-phosphate isomerase B [Deltaproteobacteria bacterium CG11_big_fil_rev_8_21_14_0_20_45_16]|nr:MAG: ribose 5-phosphate isomerase B [Deltaproteobacteria bacterium CG11_big_fil_rev_8_21_14_0_20_45_16]
MAAPKILFWGADHAGFELKQKLIEHFKKKIICEDLGTNSSESCDYPDFAESVAKKVLDNSGSLGVLICGTGLGMSMAANKVHGIRAGAVSETFSAEMARRHNDAQILCVGSRVLSFDKARECIEAFLATELDIENPRHLRRIHKIQRIEENGATSD